MNKKYFLLYILAFLSLPVFSQSQNNETESESEELEAFDEDFDAMFDEASDTEAVIVVDTKAPAQGDRAGNCRKSRCQPRDVLQALS